MQNTQFSLRGMFLAIVIAAIGAWVMYQASKGSAWARGATFGIASLLALVLMHVLFNTLGMILGRISRIAAGDGHWVVTQNPFATTTPPPRPLPAEME